MAEVEFGHSSYCGRKIDKEDYHPQEAVNEFDDFSNLKATAVEKGCFAKQGGWLLD
jgi:hypothetical protein